jgi:hypothetical protein
MPTGKGNAVPADQADTAQATVSDDHPNHAAPGPSRSRFQFVYGGELAEPLASTPFLVRQFGIAPGRPTLLLGFGGNGKTILAQEFALCVAAGRPRCWGGVKVARASGAVRHIDYEMTREPPQRRYQRLAHGLGIDLAALGERFGLCSMPSLYLIDEEAEHELTLACEGVALVVLDSLAAATPGAKENEASMRRWLDKLTRVSAMTGTVFLVIHHAGKVTEGNKDRPALQRARGASAITDAAGSAVSVSCVEGVLTLAQTKSSLQREGEEIVVRLVDDDEEAVGAWWREPDPGKAMRMFLKRPEMLSLVVRRVEQEPAAQEGEALDQATARIREALGDGALSYGDLIDKLSGRKASNVAALKAMRSRGHVVAGKSGTKVLLKLAGPTDGSLATKTDDEGEPPF